MAEFKGGDREKGYTLSKDSVVKVLDKKDHGTSEVVLQYMGRSRVVEVVSWDSCAGNEVSR